MAENKPIIIFDGICNFCNSSVNFIIRRDPKAVFVFTPMQSDSAKALLSQHGIDSIDLDTFVLIKGGQCFIRTDAALEISKDLTGWWPMLRVFKWVPRSLRDIFYRVFARNRYKLFGKREVCMLPSAEVRSRFVG